MFVVYMDAAELANGNYSTNHFMFLRKWTAGSSLVLMPPTPLTQPRQQAREERPTFTNSVRQIIDRIIRPGTSNTEADLESQNVMLPPQPDPHSVVSEPIVENAHLGGKTTGRVYIKQAYLSLNGKGLQSTSMVNASENDCAEEYINFARTTGNLGTGKWANLKKNI